MSAEDAPLITHARHRDYLESAVRHLEEFQAFREFSVAGRRLPFIYRQNV